jgi:pimeloyl-ACP methyl ester carboxylesterase
MDRFQINIKSSVIEDLKERIANTRWTDEIDNGNWEHGTNKSYLMELCDYWQNGFSWKMQEDFLNSFENYKTEIDGIGLHYLFHKGEGKKRIPILLTHGWPDSFVRFLKIIPLLTEADKNGLSFDVVVPSIPGYGFSDIPKELGMNKKMIANLFTQLMTNKLGYNKFIVHGGDLGSGVTEQIGLYASNFVYGLHLTDLPFEHSIEEPKNANEEEKKYFEAVKKWEMSEGAYASIQSTKPQSLSYGLNDSPVGMAGWMIEKFKAWSDNNGNIESAFTKDELLTNLTIYWATQTINSSIRIYYESVKAIKNSMYNPLAELNPFDKTGQKSQVPTAFALFPKDISKPPKSLAERYFNIVQWTEFSAGGHFGAMEQPELLAKDLRKFAESLQI